MGVYCLQFVDYVDEKKKRKENEYNENYISEIGMLDTELTNKLNEFVKIGVDAHKTLVERAELNQNFRVGKQWSVEEYEAYKKKGVIPLVINHCLPVINTLSRCSTPE